MVSNTRCGWHLDIINHEHMLIAIETRLPSDRRALPVGQPRLGIANMTQLNPIIEDRHMFDCHPPNQVIKPADRHKPATIRLGR